MQAQVNNDASLEIVLKMVMEPDLRLKFGSSGQYLAWKQAENFLGCVLHQIDWRFLLLY